jgi:hypothetical protein
VDDETYPDPSHPFLTTELLKLRAEQRRLIASLPDSLFSKMRPSGPGNPPEPPSQPERAEWKIRQFLQGRIDEGQALGTKMKNGPDAQATALTELYSYLQGWMHLAQDDYRFEKLLACLGTESKNLPQQVDPGIVSIAPELVALADLADSLADDGYQDPRVTRMPAGISPEG